MERAISKGYISKLLSLVKPVQPGQLPQCSKCIKSPESPCKVVRVGDYVVCEHLRDERLRRASELEKLTALLVTHKGILIILLTCVVQWCYLFGSVSEAICGS